VNWFFGTRKTFWKSAAFGGTEDLAGAFVGSDLVPDETPGSPVKPSLGDVINIPFSGEVSSCKGRTVYGCLFFESFSFNQEQQIELAAKCAEGAYHRMRRGCIPSDTAAGVARHQWVTNSCKSRSYLGKGQSLAEP
jgi:hypothetical protein